MESNLYEPERFQSPEYLSVLDPAAGGQATFPAAAIAELRRIAGTGYPLEICGLLVGTIEGDRWQIREVRQIANLNSERASDRFQLDPAGYQQVDRELRGSGLEIIGVFHTHPDCPGKPSPTDLDSAWEGFLYPIISVCDGEWCEMRCWTLAPEGDRFREVEWKELA